MEHSLHLVPRPRSVARRPGCFTLTPETLICLPAAAGDDDLFAARQLRREIGEVADTPQIERQFRPHRSENTIVLLRASRDAPAYPPAEFGWEVPAAPLPDQAYRLWIGPKGVVVAADSASGLFYGVQTLRQLVRIHGADLPQVVIDDAPVLRERGVMLDVCRGKVPTLATLKELVEKLCFFKINQFQMHQEHNYFFPRHPDIGATTDRLTNEEILELDALCRKLHIDLVPNLQSFGHMMNILSLPAYRHLAETEICWSLAPTVDEGYGFLDELYADLIPAFSSDQFNVNCDETYDLGKGKSEKRAQEIGPGRLYLEHMLRVHELCKSYGKRMQMWADILLQHPEVISDLPQEITLLDWHYEAQETYPSTKLLGDSRRRFIVCPGTSSWNALFPRIDNSNRNIRTLAREGAERGAVGLLNTDWGDHGHYQPLGQSFYGFAFGAEQAWTGGQTPDEVFDPAFGLLFFGPEQGDTIVKTVRMLGAVNTLPGVPRPNASNTVYAFFDEPLRGRMVEGMPAETAKELRETGRAAEEVFLSAACGNREEMALREMAFSARLIAETGEKVALSQRINAGWAEITGGSLEGKAARAEIGRWLDALDERWHVMERLRGEFMEVWCWRAKPKGMAETLGRYRGVLARYDVAADWLRGQRQALAEGQPVDAELKTYGAPGYHVLWDRPWFLKEED